MENQNSTVTEVAVVEVAAVAVIEKVATEQDILTEMKNQLDLNGETTAHEVKKSLRADGFTTTQSEVSTVLKTTIGRDDIAKKFNGKYLTYYSVTPSEVVTAE